MSENSLGMENIKSSTLEGEGFDIYLSKSGGGGGMHPPPPYPPTSNGPDQKSGGGPLRGWFYYPH